jgi:TRAP-type C4-dicarboxylate transport system substrate-binding protein
MPWMNGRTRLAAVMLAVIAAAAAGGCSGGGAGGDKAGGSGTPVVLRMANTTNDLDVIPLIKDFVSQVRERSGDNVHIQVVNRWGEYAPDAEQRVVRDVAVGKVDLGWTAARVFDTLGVTSFQALQAPMLIDNYALEHAVITSDIPAQMMEGLSKVGVTGIGTLADGLRKPIAVKQPMLGLADWRGMTIGTYRSQGQAQAIRALGATPMEAFGPFRDQALKAGKMQGFELDLYLYNHQVLTQRAPYVTANVNLWPQTDVLFANPDRLTSLTGQQRGWLRQAAQDVAGRSASLADRDSQILRNACQSGARFTTASQADLAALRAAFAPVYASLEQDPQTKVFIQRIQALKQSTPAAAPLAIPAGCTGKAPERPAQRPGTMPASLNGTYRYILTKEDARKGGEANLDEYPSVVTVTLKDGHMDNGPGEPGTTYTVDGDRITFDVPAWGYPLTFTFSADGKGNLHLTPVPPMDKGDQFVWSTKVWTKIA